MKPREHILRLHELLGIVLKGLDGHPFTWGNGQRLAWTPLLKEAGVTLVTKTQIEKRGMKLKRGAKPVGCAYFGAPIQRYADLYVLEVQCVKPKPPDTDCWLFLDCFVMTGFPALSCPNRKHCKQNALHSSNRSCPLPYTYQQALPHYGKPFDYEGSLLVVYPNLPLEAIAAGWHPASKLFYEYRSGGMWIGTKENGGFLSLSNIPQEAQALGFARAVWLPYHVYSDWKERNVSVLEVGFPKNDPDYQDAIFSGWYPACELPIHSV